MIPAGRVVEYRFVDPSIWDGDGEIVRDPMVIAGWKRRLAKIYANVQFRQLHKLAVPPHLADVETILPTQTRTLLIRREVS